MNNTHLIAEGNESAKFHVTGLPRFKADEAIIFSSSNVQNTVPLSEVLRNMGVQCKVVSIERNYLDSYKKASFEAAAAFTHGACIGINMSTGPNIVRTAMEDAVRIQLYHFLHHTSTEEISAFKYFVSAEDSIATVAVPIWDFATYLYNDIFEILAAAEKPITLAQTYRALIRTMGREAPKWEAFRKTFREFKRCIKGSPCFVEVVGKGPRYQIQV